MKYKDDIFKFLKLQEVRITAFIQLVFCFIAVAGILKKENRISRKKKKKNKKG